ncbi:MAG: calcium/sodium antiporter [Candidatus Thermoplasmatota archaeon]|nr:calcium/sodium antiporter [Candidatus Thermoplasmatota archaeon]MBS3789287.1 calcium/sodium antiporter [Candidatus Thermoplasmatota archaeon]
MFLILGWTAILAIGIVLLVKGADFLVDGGAKIAAYLGVPTIIIGLTLVSFGTSLPELGASLNAVLKSRQGISVGNVVGSNIANILLVLGVSSIIRPISVDVDVIKREIPMMFGAMALFVLFAGPILSDGNRIERWQGGLLLLALVAYLVFFASIVLKGRDDEIIDEVEKEERKTLKEEFHWPMNILKVTGGIFGIIVGSELAIRSAIFYIERFDLIEGVVGLTIIALATSLPELSTSSIAAFKEEADISLGNVIGSNTFNILMVIGVSAVVIPLTFSEEIYSSFLVMIIVSVFLTISIYLGEKLSRVEGIVMVVAYFAYILYLY